MPFGCDRTDSQHPCRSPYGQTKVCPNRLSCRFVEPIGSNQNIESCQHKKKSETVSFYVGAPDRIRTCDLWLRKPTLYPTELRALHSIFNLFKFLQDYSVLPCTPPLRGQFRFAPLFKFVPDKFVKLVTFGFGNQHSIQLYPPGIKATGAI